MSEGTIVEMLRAELAAEQKARKAYADEWPRLVQERDSLRAELAAERAKRERWEQRAFKLLGRRFRVSRLTREHAMMREALEGIAEINFGQTGQIAKACLDAIDRKEP